MNKILRLILTLSILYWTMFYVIADRGLWLPIPFILIGIIWFYDSNDKNYKDRYELKQNNNGEYYIFDNKSKKSKSLGNNDYWYSKDDYYFSNCLTKNKEIAELFFNRIIS